MRLGITGSDGLIGYHLSAYIQAHHPEVTLIRESRALFETHDRIQQFVQSCDVIVHLAGMNRGDDSEIERVNPELAQQLTRAAEEANVTPHILFSSSTHMSSDSPYGRSKKEAHEIFSRWSSKNDAPYTCLVLSHVFGEHGRPFYNSVISTFCHQILHGEQSEVSSDGVFRPIHAQDVALAIMEQVSRCQTGQVQILGEERRVADVYESLVKIHSTYIEKKEVPALGDPFELALFNTFRSYSFPEKYPFEYVTHRDSRGHLFEAVRSHQPGLLFSSVTHPGITRGNHFHLKKVERFSVAQGTARIQIRPLFSDKIHRFDVSGDHPVYIDIPTLCTHDITNTGETPLVTLFWAHEHFDPKNPDTFSEPVEPQT